MQFIFVLMVNLSSCRVGNIYLKLAKNKQEIELAQKLRHFVFFEEPKGETEISGKIDSDEFDEFCEHLLVVDGTEADNEKVVGTYRLLRKTADKDVQKFYTETEFDISKLKNSGLNLLELGRSCIHPEYRDGKVIQLLWNGIGIFIAHHDIKYLFGCGSFPGANAKNHEVGLSYLHHFHSVADDIAPSVKPELAAKYNIIPKEKLDKKEGLRSLPTLLKGYIRTGCKIGKGAFIDNFCDTTDVCIVLDTTNLAKRYSEHFVKK